MNEAFMREIAIRMLAAFAAGFCLGLERQFHRQPAGLKTVILICAGSSLLMLVSLRLAGAFAAEESDFRLGDPARIASQVVSGIGFLGAGAIIRQGLNIKGLTTAATIWLSAAIGLACGAGEFFPAFIALLIALCTLIIMEKIEEKVFPAKKIKTLRLICNREEFSIEEIQDALAAHKVIASNIDMSMSKSSNTIKVFLQIHVPDFLDTAAFCAEIEKIASIAKVEIYSELRTKL